MDAEYEIWSCNPKDLIKIMQAFADFVEEFDHAPFQEYDANGRRHFQNLISENWAWKQAVHVIYILQFCNF